MPRTSHADCDCVAGGGLLMNPRSIEGNADGCCRVDVDVAGGPAAADGVQELRFAAANDCLRCTGAAGTLRSPDSRACMRSWAARFSVYALALRSTDGAVTAPPPPLGNGVRLAATNGGDASI